MRKLLLLLSLCLPLLLNPPGARAAELKTFAELPTAAIADGDLIPFWDISASGLAKTRTITFGDFKTTLSLEVPLTFSTGLTRTVNTITVNASQTQVTALGTIATGTWQATPVADGYIASAATWNAKQNALTAGVDYLAPAGNGSGLTGLTKSQVGLGNVENTALSTWAGSTNLTTLGTIATGTWQATPVADGYIASAATWNAKQNALTAGVDYLAPSGNGSGLTGLTKSQVGLGNVPNTDATARGNHTGTQLASTISDFTTAAKTAVNATTSLSPGATVNIDFAGSAVQQLTINQLTTLTTSNLAAGRSVKLVLDANPTTTPGYRIIVPSSWNWMNEALEHIGTYGSISAVEVDLRSTGTTDANVYAKVTNKLWTPAEIKNLKFWFEFTKSQCFSDTAGTVPCVADDPILYVRPKFNNSSNPAVHLKQTASGEAPLFKEDGLSFSLMDGTQHLLFTDGSGTPAPSTLYMSDTTLYLLFKLGDAGSLEILSDLGSGPSGLAITTGGAFQFVDSTGSDTPTGISLSSAGYHLMVLRNGFANLNYVTFGQGKLQGGGLDQLETSWAASRQVICSRLGDAFGAGYRQSDAGTRLVGVIAVGEYVARDSVLDALILDYIRKHYGYLLY